MDLLGFFYVSDNHTVLPSDLSDPLRHRGVMSSELVQRG